jgi:hypothetical protein
MIDYLKNSAWQGVKFTAKHVGIPMAAGAACGYLLHKSICVWKILPKLGNFTPVLTSPQAAIGCAVATQIAYLVVRISLKLFPNTPFIAQVHVYSAFFSPILLTSSVTSLLGFTFTVGDLFQFIAYAFFLGSATIGTTILALVLLLKLLEGAVIVARAVRAYFQSPGLTLIQPQSSLALIS